MVVIGCMSMVAHGGDWAHERGGAWRCEDRLVPGSVHGVRAAAAVVIPRHHGGEEGGEHEEAH